jgi:hypothetical protein
LKLKVGCWMFEVRLLIFVSFRAGTGSVLFHLKVLLIRRREEQEAVMFDKKLDNIREKRKGITVIYSQL